MPGSVRVHSLATLSVPSIQKSFYKADRGQIKWNSSGTSLLFLSSTDHDKTGKSYYGETNLYLMTPALQYEARLVLDKEGGIGDFAWNPANGGKEFAVSYGWMPAKTTLFDLRLNVLHEFGALPRNYVSFNPQGRLLCIAGFGNLAGQMDIWDRSTLKKVANFQVNNCTECTWSPDGRLLMCSTLSPRLRVDNGIRIHHWTGSLIHLQTTEELYQVRAFPSTISEVSSVGRAKLAVFYRLHGGLYRPPNSPSHEHSRLHRRHHRKHNSSNFASLTQEEVARTPEQLHPSQWQREPTVHQACGTERSHRFSSARTRVVCRIRRRSQMVQKRVASQVYQPLLPLDAEEERLYRVLRRALTVKTAKRRLSKIKRASSKTTDKAEMALQRVSPR